MPPSSRGRMLLVFCGGWGEAGRGVRGQPLRTPAGWLALLPAHWGAPDYTNMHFPQK